MLLIYQGYYTDIQPTTLCGQYMLLSDTKISHHLIASLE